MDRDVPDDMETDVPDKLVSDEAVPSIPLRRSHRRIFRFLVLVAFALLIGGAFLCVSS